MDMNAMTVLDLLSNDEAETLTLEYGRDGSDETKTVNLARVKIKIENPVSFFVKERADKSRLGYIKLRDFSNKAVPEMKEAIKALDRQNVDAIVLDLRGNTGGGFQFALNIGGMFLDNKNMATTVSRNEEKVVFKSSFQDGVLTQLPLILWMDQLSASASEVLAGGLHDNCRALLVGSNSFGKGKIQAVFG